MARPEGFEPSCDRLEDGCLKSARLRTREFCGAHERDRTAGLIPTMDALSLLSYEGVDQVVGTNGIEPLTSAVSGQCSAAELRACIYMWGDVRGSNPQPPSSQPGALAA
jgi:hypothetical protein